MATKESTKTSAYQMLKEANRYIAGGVVSLNRKVIPHIIFERGKGSKIYDTEGKEYIDYHAAFAPHLLGHNHPAITEAVLKVLEGNRSLMGSGTNEYEIALAKEICGIIPSCERIQITNTGSEGTAHAIRLSRAFTGREDIILILGGYNGWHNDVCRVVMPTPDQAGRRVQPGEYPFIQLSAGIPESIKRKIHIVNYNDLESIEYVMSRFPIACVLTEPVLQNVGVILPRSGYLQGLIDLCEKYGAVSVFDEVKTGFRTALGGYQGVAGVKPHISVFGKAIANGYPLGVVGGRKEIMDLFDSPDPHKRVLIAGTYNAHPVNVAAALATIRILKEEPVYESIQKQSSKLYSGLESMFMNKGIPMSLARNASAFCMYFSDLLPVDLHDILSKHDFTFDIKFRKALIEEGIYHIPLPCKQCSISYSHTNEDIDKTLEATWRILKGL